MCRSHADGGRLCPSQTDPKLIANRNARRRAAYAKKKSTDGFNSLGNMGEKVTHSVAPGQFTHSVFGYKLPDDKPTPDLYSLSSAEEKSPLGITVKSHQGYLVENDYFSAIQVSGLLNYTNLNENSYKEFGFQDPSEIRKIKMAHSELYNLSLAEIEGFTFGDKKALATFTTNDYEWINDSLYGHPSLCSETDEEKEEYVRIYNDETLLTDTYSYSEPEDRTPSRLRELTGKMDEALLKGPKQQRILYRGMGSYHTAWDNNPDNMDGYIDTHFPLGQEVKFDGYQSVSYSPAVAGNYAGDDGVVFEISTPSGVNVSEISHFGQEREAILPRDSRYMVVGLHKKQVWKNNEINGPDVYRHNVTLVQLVEITEEGYVRDETNMAIPTPLRDDQTRTYN